MDTLADRLKAALKELVINPVLLPGGEYQLSDEDVKQIAKALVETYEGK